MCHPKYKWAGSSSKRNINIVNPNVQQELDCDHRINNKYQVPSEKLFLIFCICKNQ